MTPTSNQNVFSPFPDILATPAEKASADYGKQYARAIWGRHTVNILQYNTQRQRDIINRQYREGLESIEKFKTRKGITNTSYLNLDYSPINIIAPLIDKIIGRLTEIPYKIQCNPIDPESKARFDNYRKQMYADMFLKPYSDEIEKATGIPLVPKNKKIPESTEEAELHLKMNFKDDASIAMEEAFDYVMYNNAFDASREKIIEDLLTLKRAAYQTRYDETGKIIIERIDVVDVITPYSKYDDFRNIPYIAVIKNYTIGELAVMNPKWTDEDLYNIAKHNQGKNNNPAWNWSTSYEGYYASNDFSVRPYYNFNIQVLEYYFLAIDKNVKEFKEYKKRKFINAVGKDFIPKEGSEVITKDIQNLYQGRWVIGTDYVFNHEKAKNIPREKSYVNGDKNPTFSTKATLPIKIIAPGIFDMQNKSLVERMIPHEDAIKLAEMGMQVMMIKAKPPGVAIDVRGLIDAAKGMGKEWNPMEIVKMYQESGNFVFSSMTEEGDVVNSRVITELKGGISDAIGQFINVFQFHKNLINEVIGSNPMLDPMSSKPNVGLGVQDNAITSANEALRPIYSAFIRLTESAMKDVALMIQDSIEYENEEFVNGIGTYSTKVLEMGKDLSYAQMGIKIELLPDDKEKGELMSDIQLGIQQGLLNSSDAIRVRQVMKENVKLAAQLLVFLEDKNRKDAQAAKTADIKNNGQVQQQSAAAASQARQEEMAMALDIEKQKKDYEFQIWQKMQEIETANELKKIAGKNLGIENVANINAGKAVNVQTISTQGKLEESRVAADNKVEVKHIEHESKIQHGLLNHDSKMGQMMHQGMMEKENAKENKKEKGIEE